MLTFLKSCEDTAFRPEVSLGTKFPSGGCEALRDGGECAGVSRESSQDRFGLADARTPLCGEIGTQPRYQSSGAF